MPITFKIGILFSFLWICIKLSFLYLGIFQETNSALTFDGFSILFFLVSSISIGLYIRKRRDKDETNAFLDLKNAMASGMIFSVIISLFIYLYHSRIDQGFHLKYKAEREFKLKQAINDPKKFEALKKENGNEFLTKKEIVKKANQYSDTMGSPKMFATLTILFLTLLSTFYSIMITIIFRRIVFRAFD